MADDQPRIDEALLTEMEAHNRRCVARTPSDRWLQDEADLIHDLRHARAENEALTERVRVLREALSTVRDVYAIETVALVSTGMEKHRFVERIEGYWCAGCGVNTPGCVYPTAQAVPHEDDCVAALIRAALAATEPSDG